jgi:hypothetical protein
MANEPTVLSLHTQAAEALRDKIRALRADVPGFVHEVPDTRRRRIQQFSVPDAFLESSGVSVTTFVRLEQAVGMDAEKLREAFSYALAYDSVVKEAFAFARSVAHTIMLQRADAGAYALDIYAIATRLSKQKDGAELIPYVEDMKAKLAKHKRSRKTTTNPSPAPVVPAPEPSKKS